ncbi:hypothetical protein mRhiFer1_008292 [Rhinolophus ferrumequinum]|uniref:Uncharacterized protein n=1 Tax=Rhinolophus ferrumequinum TaxID=59479 RepID=A0A7J7VRG3_RHIFE|nr:hypothetical protein mRhiFer1_008292 [Rhinolophus ferrumequinum]
MPWLAWRSQEEDKRLTEKSQTTSGKISQPTADPRRGKWQLSSSSHSESVPQCVPGRPLTSPELLSLRWSPRGMLSVVVQICTPKPRVPGTSASDAISHQATGISSSRPQPNRAVCNLELRIKQQKDCCVVVRGEEVGNAPSDLGGREDLGKPGPAHKEKKKKAF